MQGPIPGQSLTGEPGAAPYERPPRFNKPEEAFEAYLEKFDDPDVRDGFFQILETGMPVDSLVTVLTRQAVNKGVHSVDTAVILRPIVHEYLTTLADAAGVEYVETITDTVKDKEISKKNRQAIAIRVEKQMQTPSSDEEDDLEETSDESGLDELEGMFEEEAEDDETLAAPTGLMKRPQKGT